MLKRILISFLVLGSIGISGKAVGQVKKSQPGDSLSLAVTELTKKVQAMEKIKISGYIQAQFQLADTLGTKTFNGGDFPKTSSKRFQVRRGYFKAAYTGNLVSYVLQINVNEKGFSVRDAYFTIKEPWFKTLSLTGGIFYRPFGYELSFPAQLRESPETARVTQVLLPGERDLGASLTFQLPEKSQLHPLKVEAGLFTGNGTVAETDDRLDFIGRMSWSSELPAWKAYYGVGLSYYNGSVYQAKKQVYQMETTGNVPSFHQLMNDTIVGKYQKRQYFGADALCSVKSRIGLTQLRAEFMFGKQPSVDTSSFSPTEKVNAPLYLREFSGSVLYFVHTFPNSIHSIVVKYDYYDPNTNIKGNQIGTVTEGSKATNSTDIAYTTWGLGYFADLTKNLRITLYYELLRNETSSNLNKFGTDLKDNLFTARIQLKF